MARRATERDISNKRDSFCFKLSTNSMRNINFAITIVYCYNFFQREKMSNQTTNIVCIKQDSKNTKTHKFNRSFLNASQVERVVISIFG